jgi:hypothetical protein
MIRKFEPMEMICPLCRNNRVKLFLFHSRAAVVLVPAVFIALTIFITVMVL